MSLLLSSSLSVLCSGSDDGVAALVFAANPETIGVAPAAMVADFAALELLLIIGRSESPAEHFPLTSRGYVSSIYHFVTLSERNEHECNDASEICER